MIHTNPGSPASIELSHLIPIQAGLLLSPEELLEWPHGDNEPISVMPYPPLSEDGDSRFLILDGHHRSAKQYLLARDSIRSLIISRDEDVSTSSLGSLRYCRTIADAHKEYEDHWKPRTFGKGVIDAATLSQRLLFGRA